MHKLLAFFETYIKGKKLPNLIVAPLLLLFVFFMTFLFIVVYDKEKQKGVFLDFLRYSELLSSLSLDAGAAQRDLDNYYKTENPSALANFSRIQLQIREKSHFLKKHFVDDNNFALYARIIDNLCSFQEKELASIDKDSDPARVFERRQFIVKSFTVLGRYANEFQSGYIGTKGKEFEQLLDSQEKITRTFSLALLGIVLLLSVIIVTIFRSVLRQIESVVKYAKRLSGADWEVADLAMNSLHEINVLSTAFNCMKKDIRDSIMLLKEKSDIELKYLMKCKESADRKKKYAEMRHRLLVMRLDPHFLFNSLNIVYRQCMFANQYAIMNTISDFAECLRYAIEAGEKFVTLQQELANFHAYLRLLKLRFGQDVKVDQRISVAADEIMIIPFIIQPMFEHMISCTPPTSSQKGLVTLSIDKIRDKKIDIRACYTFEIPAMEKSHASSSKFSPLAMDNLRYRLRYFYKKSFSLEEERDDRSIAFCLSIPA